MSEILRFSIDIEVDTYTNIGRLEDDVANAIENSGIGDVHACSCECDSINAAMSEKADDIAAVGLKTGDYVCARDFCFGRITKIENGIASVEFETDCGGGCLPFTLAELKHVECQK